MYKVSHHLTPYIHQRYSNCDRDPGYECIRNDLCEGLTAQVYIGLEAILVDSENFNIYKAWVETSQCWNMCEYIDIATLCVCVCKQRI